ncbi:unnamed protein product [Thlaspi arvense]|uniref:Uncharacterized protein n=1 Tax=Thlaspi arvense TaxID=13288 RepID=A0AAU9T392_THLAR|nr:unnamed protein product [Thlaspi arvense]
MLGDPLFVELADRGSVGMEGHCLVICGEWLCSGDRKWEFVIDKNYMSRVVVFREGMSIEELKENVVTEFFGNKGFGTSLGLSYWSPNSSELATGITTPLVMVNSTAAIGYFCKHCRVKDGFNLFVHFGIEAPEEKWCSSVDGGEGYSTPGPTLKRKGLFDEQSTPARDGAGASAYSGYGSSDGTKTCPLDVDDEEIFSHVEMTEERLRRGRSEMEDGDCTTRKYKSESDESSITFDENINVQPMGSRYSRIQLGDLRLLSLCVLQRLGMLGKQLDGRM